MEEVERFRARIAQLEQAKLDVEAFAARAAHELLAPLFSNLILNGLKYGPREHPAVHVDAARDGSAWQFSVRSAGPAIPAEDRERIFEPFQRGRDERRVRGAGLGLSVCRYIVERHGGRISVDTAEGGDNRFFFTLPD